MQKKSALFLLTLALIVLPSVSAFSTNLTGNETHQTATISSSEDLYAYAIHMSYTDEIVSVSQNQILGGNILWYGTNERDNVLTVYGSILDSTSPGVDIADNTDVFNVTFNGELELFYTIEVNRAGIATYTYYNGSAPVVVDTNYVGGSGGGSGGGGGGISQFDISPDLIRLTIQQGESYEQEINIENNLNSLLEITSIDADETIKPFIAAITPETPLSILPSQTTPVSLNFFARNEEVPDTYIGQIEFKSGSTIQKLNTVIEIEENKPLFDVVVDLGKDTYSPGDEVVATVEIENFGDLHDIDVLVNYAIKDFEGNIIASQEGSYAINNYKLQLVARLDIPDNVQEGDYIFYTKATYPQLDISATGSQVFKVGSPLFSPFQTGNLFVVTVLIIAVVVVIIFGIVIFLVLRKPKVKHN